MASVKELQMELKSLNDSYQKMDSLLTESMRREKSLIGELHKVMHENKNLKTQLYNITSVRNPRNAGRKKHDQKWTEIYLDFCSLYPVAEDKTEVMRELNMSRATFYRYKKIFDEQGRNAV